MVHECMMIDSHVHTWSEECPLSPGRTYTPARAMPVEELLAQLNAHGVDRAVLVQPRLLGTDNGYLVEALRQHPQRLRGVAVVAPSTTHRELDTLAAAGVVGIRPIPPGCSSSGVSATPITFTISTPGSTTRRHGRVFSAPMRPRCIASEYQRHQRSVWAGLPRTPL